jgi:hypothetical protein
VTLEDLTLEGRNSIVGRRTQIERLTAFLALRLWIGKAVEHLDADHGLATERAKELERRNVMSLDLGVGPPEA